MDIRIHGQTTEIGVKLDQMCQCYALALMETEILLTIGYALMKLEMLVVQECHALTLMVIVYKIMKNYCSKTFF